MKCQVMTLGKDIPDRRPDYMPQFIWLLCLMVDALAVYGFWKVFHK